MANRGMLKIFTIARFTLTILLLTVLPAACSSGGSSGNGTQASGASSSAAQIEALVDVSLSVTHDTYERTDDPQPFVVLAKFSEVPTNISSSSLDVGDNAVVLSFSPLAGGKSFGFSVKPDNSNQPVEIVLPRGAVWAGGLRNAESNRLIVSPIDTIAPSVTLIGEILSYDGDGVIDHIAVDISVSDTVAPLKPIDLDLQSAEIFLFVQVDERNYRVSLKNTKQSSSIEIHIPAGVLVDASGNENPKSEVLSFPSVPQKPRAVAKLEVSSVGGSLVFAWEQSPNTTSYQLVSRSSDQEHWRPVSEVLGITEPLSYSLNNIHVLDQVRRKYALRSCNNVGCTKSDSETVNEYLWAISRYFKAPKVHEGQGFGSSVAVSGDGNVMAVTAINEPALPAEPLPDQAAELYRAGAVYMYRKVDNVWQFVQIIVANDRANYVPGFNVLLNGDGSVLVVGSPENPFSSNDHTNFGASYVYRFSKDVWTLEAKLQPATSGGQRFGQASVINDSGDFVVIGAPGRHSPSTDNIGAGAVYIFDHSENDGWQKILRLDSPVPGPQFNFGTQLALDGDAETLVVGMPWGDVDTVPEGKSSRRTGMAFIYRKLDSDWSLSQIINPPTLQYDARFGSSLAIDVTGSLLLIGSPGEDDCCASVKSSGAVYSYQLHEEEFQRTNTLRPSNPVDYIDFGFDIALSADGDKLALLAIEYSDLDPGFYTEPSPNDNAPFAFPSVLLFDRSNSDWAFSTFIKCHSTVGSTLAADQSLNTIACGSYGDSFLVEGQSFLGEVDFESADRAPFSGAVYLFD